MKIHVYKISSEYLRGDHEASRLNQAALTHVLNTGYNKPRYKYKVVDSPRISKNSKIVDDLKFTEKGCYLYTVVLGKESREITLEKGNLQEWWAGIDRVVVETDESFHYTEKMVEDTIGTIGVRPYNLAYTSAEITAFTSFFPSTGKLLMNILLTDLPSLEAEHHVTVKRFIAVVIQEHELTEYYQKLGFIEKEVFEVDAANSQATRGIKSTSVFHLATLYKPIH